MKIASYNVNGIRAALRKGLLDWLKETDLDVVCLQEIKADDSQFNTDDFKQAGYPYQYWFSAEKKGYSGVGILSKHKPDDVVYGIGIETIDKEGRNLRVDFENLSVMSIYLPSGSNTERFAYKYQYMDDFKKYAETLLKTKPNLLICGDFNIAHQAIDIHNPISNKNKPGFLPKERDWLSSFIDTGFVDSFRYLNTEPDHYSWWTYRMDARKKNKGWRIDYIMASQNLKKHLRHAGILAEVEQSDHCPISVNIDNYN